MAELSPEIEEEDEDEEEQQYLCKLFGDEVPEIMLYNFK
jgi:hypothetical protein